MLKLIVLLMLLSGCRLITEYDNSEVLEVRVFRVGPGDLNVLGVEVQNDTVFNLPVEDVSKFINGTVKYANITVYGSGNDNFKVDISPSGYQITYFRK